MQVEDTWSLICVLKEMDRVTTKHRQSKNLVQFYISPQQRHIVYNINNIIYIIYNMYYNIYNIIYMFIKL